GIDSLGELWYACKDDKISKLKGFGQKTQEELKGIVEFTIENEGKFRYADAEPLAEIILSTIKDNLKNDSLLSLTGELRRCCEIVDGIEILIAIEKQELLDLVNQTNLFSEIEAGDNLLNCVHQSGIKTQFYFCSPADFYARLVETTGNEEHVNQLKAK